MSASDSPPTRATTAIARVTVACPYCGDGIVWAECRGKAMPVDATPDDAGHILVMLEGPGLVARIIDRAAQRTGLKGQGWAFRTNHRQTCRKGSEWSKPGAAASRAASRASARG